MKFLQVLFASCRAFEHSINMQLRNCFQLSWLHSCVYIDQIICLLNNRVIPINLPTASGFLFSVYSLISCLSMLFSPWGQKLSKLFFSDFFYVVVLVINDVS